MRRHGDPRARPSLSWPTPVTVLGVSNSNMIWWIVAGWLPAVMLWSFGDDLFSTMGGVAWLGFMYWVFWQRSQRDNPGD